MKETIPGSLAHASVVRPTVTRLAAGLLGRDNHVDTSKAQIELGWCAQVPYTDAIQETGKYAKKIFNS